jgi:hypothetical protein
MSALAGFRGYQIGEFEDWKLESETPQVEIESGIRV